MTDLVIADHQATFALHPLEGSSRFSLLGLLAGLNGLVGSFAFDPATDEQKRSLQEFRDKHAAPGLCPPGVLEEAERLLSRDDREMANTILGDRVVNAMFGKDGPVRVMVSGKPTSAAAERAVRPRGDAVRPSKHGRREGRAGCK